MPLLVTPVSNAFAHLSYLAWCAETGEAAAIDPYHVELTLETARAHDLRITAIVNTHEHWDHAGRNDAIVRETGARVLAPKAAMGVIETIDTTLNDGDSVTIGETCSFRVLATPGHTMTHIALLGTDAAAGTPYLLCGDTLFGAGVGNCGYGGHAPTLFDTVERLRAALDPRTRLYPGHDYLARNLAFTLAHEPGNGAAAALLEPAGAALHVTTMAEEAGINLFFRLDSPAVREALRRTGAIGPDADRRDLFLALRQARDAW
ncbi:MAG TPA: MBL fold metallo-hydrolase [Allosphingosinicella sp.]|nr:MBL fold metallo-hydrolase [Allosphingosinicella sp.]